VVDVTTATFPVTGCAGDVRGFYQVLGVARTATTEEITRARKRELRNWHPDHACDQERKERGRRATLINEAAETLLDSARRHRYDQEPFRDPREDDRRREQAAAQADEARRAAAQADEARRAAAAQARQNQQAAAQAAADAQRQYDAARAEANRRAAQAQQEADAAVAERQRVQLQRKRQIAHSLWCLVFLALVPQLAFRQLFIPVAIVSINVVWTSTLVLVLALAHLWIGAATRVFAFRSERSRVAAGAVVVLQIAAALILLFLAPAILLLIELLKIVAVLLGIIFIFMLFSS
jgi:hypothetical protein